MAPACVQLDLAAVQSLLQAKGSTPPNIDLQGQTVTGQLPPGQHLTITQPGTILSNGKLMLPPGVCILVQATKAVLKGLTISGQCSAAQLGLVAIEARDARLDECTIDIQSSVGQQNKCSGVCVVSGGSALAVQCRVTSAFEGFLSLGSGSLLTAQGCTAGDCDSCGFAAVERGVLHAEAGCKASNNKQHGFCADGTGSQLTTGDGCRADSNGGAGFCASGKGAQLTTGSGCSADSNGYSGFCAEDGGALTAGAHCTASNNTGAAGFGATNGATLTAGACCTANSNMYGFYVDGKRSLLSTGNGCSAVKNGFTGFLSVNDGALKAGADCFANDNRFGFRASKGGKMVVGPGVRASGNESNDFRHGGLFGQYRIKRR